MFAFPPLVQCREGLRVRLNSGRMSAKVLGESVHVGCKCIFSFISYRTNANPWCFRLFAVSIDLLENYLPILFVLFFPSSALQLRWHNSVMRPSLYLEYENIRTIWNIISRESLKGPFPRLLSVSPLNLNRAVDRSDLHNRTLLSGWAHATWLIELLAQQWSWVDSKTSKFSPDFWVMNNLIG